jgi:hypothetical protein
MGPVSPGAGEVARSASPLPHEVDPAHAGLFALACHAPAGLPELDPLRRAREVEQREPVGVAARHDHAVGQDLGVRQTRADDPLEPGRHEARALRVLEENRQAVARREHDFGAQEDVALLVDEGLASSEVPASRTSTWRVGDPALADARKGEPVLRPAKPLAAGPSEGGPVREGGPRARRAQIQQVALAVPVERAELEPLRGRRHAHELGLVAAAVEGHERELVLARRQADHLERGAEVAVLPE